MHLLIPFFLLTLKRGAKPTNPWKAPLETTTSKGNRAIRDTRDRDSSETIRFQVDKLVANYCERKVPLEARDQIVVTYEVIGSAVTIFENRPPWKEKYGPDWTKMKVAQLRWDPESQFWTMWWADRNGRWSHIQTLSRPLTSRIAFGSWTTTRRELSEDKSPI